MEPTELKDALKNAGIPVYENNKISRKDLPYLEVKKSGLVIEGLQYLGVDKGIDKYTYKFRITLGGGNKEKIENIFAMKKQQLEKSLTDYLKLKVACVKKVEGYLKSSNEEHAWVNLDVCFSLDAMINFDLFEPFWHRWFEQIG